MPPLKPTWRSLEELRSRRHLPVIGDDGNPRTPEFPDGADGISRRDFVTLAGASAAMLAMSGCVVKQAPTDILPYGTQPPELTPGDALHFASSLETLGRARGLLVTSYEGRPTKIEGNPDSPESLGASSLIDQARLLDLYDSRRLAGFRHGKRNLDRLEMMRALDEMAKMAAADGGARLHFLLEPSGSPLRAWLRRQITAALPHAKFHAWQPASEDEAWSGTALAFGRPLAPQYAFARADVVLALDSDFLATHVPGSLRWARDFAARRVPPEALNRLYVVEPSPTITGATSDHRLRLRASQIGDVVRAILAALGRGGARPPAGTDRFVRAVADDLRAASGRSIVIAGARQPAAVHALVAGLNELLGNHGRTIRYTAPSVDETQAGPAALQSLCEAIDRREVGTLVVSAFDPVYTAPPDVELTRRLDQVRDVVYLSPRGDDSTAPHASWVAARLHPFESWGDGRGPDGTHHLRQPLIEPIFEGLCEEEILAAFAGRPDARSRELLRASLFQTGVVDSELAWDRVLRAGLVSGSAFPTETVAVRWDALAPALAAPPTRPSEFEVAYAVDPKVLDGRFATNNWLQEVPDLITRMVWDNAALLSPRTAARLGLVNEDVVEVSVRGRAVTLPVYITPGHVDDAVTVALGYGAPCSSVGTDVYRVRSAKAPWFDAADLRTSGMRYQIAVTQDHWTMHGRKLALQYDKREQKDAAEVLDEERSPLPVLYHTFKYKVGHKWGMSIDLGRCTGCSACVVACVTENNTPVVGKDQVRRGREMQWLRIDRYYIGDEQNPELITQPVMCQHCEYAPCEYVCPVNATVHSDEGLNEMVYNRCVGTRYCSNNCPYKVRRFNYLNFTGNWTDVEQMVRNPDVTVRPRGVMEKCTYCVQRIERARIARRRNDQEIQEGDIQTACQQACPTEAIVFGDLNDGGSQVSSLHNDPRNYELLHEENTHPRTVYLARVKNRNPVLDEEG